MCNECEESSFQPISRRVFLAFSGVTLAAGLIGCTDRTPPTGSEVVPPTGPDIPAETTATQPAGPATRPVGATLQPSASGASPPPPSMPAPPPSVDIPARDLGSALFPDATGRPIAYAADCPVRVEPRKAWTTTAPQLAQMVLMNGVARMTIHHTGFNHAWEDDRWKPTATEIENIRAFHAGAGTLDRGWADIAYHFVIDRAGRVWQGRPLVYQGAHVRHHNEHNIGIVLLGNFNLQRPSAAQATNLASFCSFLRQTYEIPLAEIYTHGELGHTDCPGKHLTALMNRLRQRWQHDELEP